MDPLRRLDRVGAAELPLVERRDVPHAHALAHGRVLGVGIAERDAPVPAALLDERGAPRLLDGVERRLDPIAHGVPPRAALYPEFERLFNPRARYGARRPSRRQVPATVGFGARREAAGEDQERLRRDERVVERVVRARPPGRRSRPAAQLSRSRTPGRVRAADTPSAAIARFRTSIVRRRHDRDARPEDRPPGSCTSTSANHTSRYRPRSASRSTLSASLDPRSACEVLRAELVDRLRAAATAGRRDRPAGGRLRASTTRPPPHRDHAERHDRVRARSPAPSPRSRAPRTPRHATTVVGRARRGGRATLSRSARIRTVSDSVTIASTRRSK